MNNFRTHATPKPGQASPVITEDTAQRLNFNLEAVLNKLSLQADEEPFYFRRLDADNIFLEFDRQMKQFTVYNPTARSIFIDITDVDATHYLFNVATLKYFISPPFLFTVLKIFQTPFVAGSINPVLTAHSKVLLNPGSFVIP